MRDQGEKIGDIDLVMYIPCRIPGCMSIVNKQFHRVVARFHCIADRRLRWESRMDGEQVCFTYGSSTVLLFIYDEVAWVGEQSSIRIHAVTCSLALEFIGVLLQLASGPR